MPYDYETTDQDERVMTHSAIGTDFASLGSLLDNAVDAPKVKSVDEFNGAWATLIAADTGRQRVYGFRRAPEGYNLKKMGGLFNAVFSDARLREVESGVVIRIDRRIDFIAFDDQLFIYDKSKFERGLNSRVGMEAARDRLFNSFESMALFEDIAPLRDACGNNVHSLRKLNSIAKSGYYSDATYMAKLKAAVQSNGWNLKFSDSAQIVVTPDTVALVMTLLNNNRLQSIINEERFDIDGVKIPIG